MSAQDLYGSLADARGYRASDFSLEITSSEGHVLEQIDLQDVEYVGRDHASISIRLRNGTTRIYSISSIDDAGRLEEHIQARLRPAPVRPAAPAPMAQQSVRVEQRSRSSMLGPILGAALLILVVLLALLVFNALRDDNGEDDPSISPTEEPGIAPTDDPGTAPTEEPAAEPTAEQDATPQAMAPEGYWFESARRGGSVEFVHLKWQGDGFSVHLT